MFVRGGGFSGSFAAGNMSLYFWTLVKKLSEVIDILPAVASSSICSTAAGQSGNPRVISFGQFPINRKSALSVKTIWPFSTHAKR